MPSPPRSNRSQILVGPHHEKGAFVDVPFSPFQCIRTTTTSALWAPRHPDLQPRSCLRGRSNFKHGLGDRSFNQPAARCISLGTPVPGSLSPLYKGQLLVHGLGFSPDSKTVAVVSVASNSVTLIDTATNAVKGTVYVGRSPHEAFFTRDGKELWVTRCAASTTCRSSTRLR